MKKEHRAQSTEHIKEYDNSLSDFCALNQLPSVSEMMRDCGLEPKKQFGQNFLFDLNLTGRIARSVPNIESTPVIEVGPGPAGLTRALLLAGAPRVIAIEKDTATAPILSRVADASDGRLEIIYGDALKVDTEKLNMEKYAICANLPYNVGTELLIGWLHKIANGAPIQSLTLMFQREVAYRIVANPGDAQYGRLSVLVSLLTDAKILFDVPNTAFVPKPKVQSAVVQLIPNAKKIRALGNLLPKVENITAKLFGTRRKMIRGIMPEFDWESVGLAGTERAENLSPEIFMNVVKKLLP